MAINIEDFRKSLKVGISKDLIEKIVTKYENFDFSNVDTNNGNKLREIDLYDEENKKEYFNDELAYFLNQILKSDYLVSRNAYLKFAASDSETRKKTIQDASKVLRNSLYSRPDTLTIKSNVVLDNPQKDESVHILTLNVDSSAVVSVAQALYHQLSEYGIPFDFEIPKASKLNDGNTETIKLHVPTMDLEDTIKAINRLDNVYKNKIKKPNMLNANIQDLIGYDSLIDIDGTRTSDLFGVSVIKALDKTLIDLAKDETFEGLTPVDFIKNAENKDEARQRVLREVKTKYPDIYETIRLNVENVINDEKMPLDIDNIYASELAQSELNAEFGIYEDEEEITNVNEIVNVEEETLDVETPEKVKVLDKVVDAASGLKRDFKAGIDALLSPNLIQPAIMFGSGSLERVHEEAEKIDNYESLKTETPTVEVIEPIVKDEFNELKEPTFDTIDENVEPALKAEDVPSVEPVTAPVEEVTPVQEVTPVEEVPQEEIILPGETEVKEEPKEEFVLPGEDEFVTPSVVPEAPKDAIVVNPTLKAPATEEPKEEQVDVVTALATDPVLYNDDKEASLYEDENVSIEPTNSSVDSTTQNNELNELNEIESKPSEISLPGEDTAKEEPAFIEQSVETPSDVVIPEATGITIEDDSQVEVQTSTDTEVYKEPVEEKHEDVVIPDDSELTQVIPVVDTLKQNGEPIIPDLSYLNDKDEDKDGIDYIMKAIEDADNNVDEKTIELSELGKNINESIQEPTPVVQEQPRSASELTQEEAVAVVDNVEPVKTIDPVKQQRIDRYNGVSIDPQIYDFQIKDEDDNVIKKRDGSPYTFLDYLDYNQVSSVIPLDSKVYLKDDTKADFVDGRTFIREYVLPAAVGGNNSIDEIIDRYVKEPSKKKGIFGFMKK